MRWKTQHGVVALPAILLFLCGGVQLVCGVRVDDVDDVNNVYGATAVNSDATEVEEADTKAAEKHPIALAEAVATAASAVRSVATAVVTAVSKATVAPEALPFAGTSLVLRTFGGFKPFNTWMLCRYLEQLEGTGMQLAVLHDMAELSSLMQDDRSEDDSSPRSEELRDDDRNEDDGGNDMDQEDGASNFEAMRAVEQEYDSRTGIGAVKAYCPKRGMVRVPLCRVTWKMVKDKFPGKEYLDRFETWQNWGPHELTDLFLVHWWSQCSTRLTTPQDNVWFVEPDAFFQRRRDGLRGRLQK